VNIFTKDLLGDAENVQTTTLDIRKCKRAGVEFPANEISVMAEV
jgi:hypothetical protein